MNETNCVVKTPAKVVCQAVAKTRVDPPPPGGGGSAFTSGFFCYRFKCQKGVKRAIEGVDQFADRSLLLGDSQLLCAPAVICPAGMFRCPTVPGVCVFNCEGCPSGSFVCPANRTCTDDCTDCASGDAPAACPSTSTCTTGCDACPGNPATCTTSFGASCTPDCSTCTGGTCD